VAKGISDLIPDSASAVHLLKLKEITTPEVT
jgi:hypothetical protein